MKEAHMNELSERVAPAYLEHGTPAPYNSKHCRCDYCSAAARVYKRFKRQAEDPKPLMALVRQAALDGAPLPELAKPQVNNKARFNKQHRTRTTGEKAKTDLAVKAAADAAHQARLRAVEHVNGDVAKLALLSVAEITTDPLRELRYRRVVDAL